MDDMNLLYESMLINEMTEEVINYVDEHKEDWPFDKIFGEDKRIIIPLNTDGEAGEILQSLRGIKDFSKFDFDNNEVVRKVKLDPKYGQGSEKEQRISLGKAINNLKIDPELKKKYLGWFAKYKDEIKNQFKESEYSIILSRAPIDVVRMSDHRNISSCHSQGNSYFKCAVQEALTGGAIAYLVNRDSLEGLDEEELQEDDLFKDSDRNVRGIEPPVARLRVRNVGGNAIPETRVYGATGIPGFYDSLRDYLQSVQKLSVDDFQDEEGGKDMDLYGGSYADSNIGDIIKKYLGDDGRNFTEHGNYPARDETAEYDHERLGNRLEEELKDIDDSENSFDHFSARYDFDDYDGEPFFSMWGSVEFDFSDLEFNIEIDDAPDIEDNYDFDKAVDGDYDDDVLWSSFFAAIPDGVSEEYITHISVEGGSVRISFTSGEESISQDSDDYLYFLRTIKKMDNDYDDYLSEFITNLEGAGFIRDKTTEGDGYSRLKNLDEFEGWDHLEIDGTSWRNYKVGFEIPLLLNDKSSLDEEEIRDKKWHFQSDFRTNVADMFRPLFISHMLKKMLKDLYKPKPKNDDSQMEFKSFYESYTNEFEIFNQFNVTKSSSMFGLYDDIVVKFEMESDNWTDEFFNVLDTMDDSFINVKQLMNYFMYHQLENYLGEKYPEIVPMYRPTNFKQLEKVYKKYTQ